MQVTVCELPSQPDAVEAAWRALCAHTARVQPDLVVLPEFAWVEPVWESPTFDPARWGAAVAQTDAWMQRLPELKAACVVGARPVTDRGRPLNEGFAWTPAGGTRRLRRKFHLPDEPGGWEARWWDRGDPAFPVFDVAGHAMGLNICTELWALDTLAGYAHQGVQAILTPRAAAAATTGKWLSLGTVAAVRSGTFSISSNRVDDRDCYGGAGWIIDPDGLLMARTSAEQPFCTAAVDLSAPHRARHTYPRYVFEAPACSSAQPTQAPLSSHPHAHD